MATRGLAERGDPSILVVDDDHLLRRHVVKKLQEKGYKVSSAGHGRQALRYVRRQRFDVALVDMKLPDVDGLELMRQMKSQDPLLEVVIFTGYASIDSAVEAMRQGAYDYLTKPFETKQVEVVCEKACEKRTLRLQNEELRRLVSADNGPGELIGRSKAIKKVREVINQVARSDITVLIEGESGTGKELCARAIHRLSGKPSDCFVALNCGAIPPTLLESELFGYVKGAFTGAVRDKKGLLEVAEGGTLFLDEIAEMDLAVQAKLLRVLDTGEFHRLGSTRKSRVNTRLIAATNKSLREEVEKRRFRQDLFYRLKVVGIVMPPLRERKEDLPLLVQSFLKTYAVLGHPPKEIGEDAWEVLWHYDWPGNVRELHNVLKTSFLLSKGSVITANDLPISSPVLTRKHSSSRLTPLKELERQHILLALHLEDGNRTKAAAALGIHRRHLYRLLQKHHIDL